MMMKKRTVLIAIGMACICGCGNSKVTRTYMLGDKPETTIAMIDMIAENQMVQEYKNNPELFDDKSKVTVFKIIESEGTVIVNTTPEGHRQISDALNDFQRD